jgi:hypothetical protein
MKLWFVIFLMIAGFGVAAWSFIGGNALSSGLAQQVTLSDLQNYVNSGSEREYSWNQRVTLTIDANNGPISSSSVIKVTWTENSPRINDASWTPQVYGEMPIISLSNGDQVFALFTNAQSRHLAERFLLSGATVEGLDSPVGLRQLETLRENHSITFSDDLFPRLVSFSDISDPRTISIFEPTSARVDVVLLDRASSDSLPELAVPRRIPWIEELPRGRSKRSPTAIEMPDGTFVVPTRDDFVRD